MEGTSTEEVLLKGEIEDLPVVSSLSFILTIGRDKTGPTQSNCLHVLGEQIRQDHGSDIVVAVQAWQDVSSSSDSTKRPVDEGASSCNVNDVLILRA
jgi:hypothetical protein